MRFKVELLIKDRSFIRVFFAENLEILSQQITAGFPTAKVVSIVGG